MKFTPKNIITYVGNMLAKILINMGSRALVALAYGIPVVNLGVIALSLLSSLGITNSAQGYVAAAITMAFNTIIPGIAIV